MNKNPKYILVIDSNYFSGVWKNREGTNIMEHIIDTGPKRNPQVLMTSQTLNNLNYKVHPSNITEYNTLEELMIDNVDLFL